jgi:hypothetical protein
VGIPGFEPARADDRQDSLRNESTAVDVSLFCIATVRSGSPLPFVTLFDKPFYQSEEVRDDVFLEISSLKNLV